MHRDNTMVELGTRPGLHRGDRDCENMTNFGKNSSPVYRAIPGLSSPG